MGGGGSGKGLSLHTVWNNARASSFFGNEMQKEANILDVKREREREVV